jgi:hypothetical protein
MSSDKPPDGGKPNVRADNSYRGNDPRDINYDHPAERAYWLKVLGVSDQELRMALNAVGVSAQRVKDFLAGQKGS